MPSETRYFRGDRHAVNTINVFILGREPSNTPTYNLATIPDNTWDVYFGVRVYVAKPDGSLVELTPGDPVPIAFIPWGTTPVETTGSGFYTPPEISVGADDAILVEVYAWGVYGNNISLSMPLLARFITERLGASLIPARQWVIHLHIGREGACEIPTDPTTCWATAKFFFGDSSSKIEGFSYLTPVEASFHHLFQMMPSIVMLTLALMIMMMVALSVSGIYRPGREARARLERENLRARRKYLEARREMAEAEEQMKRQREKAGEKEGEEAGEGVEKREKRSS